MDDSLKDALSRAADEAGASQPDVDAIEQRGRSRRRRRFAVTGLVSIVVAAAVVLPLNSLSRIGPHPTSVAPATERGSVSANVAPGVRCTASMPHLVEPGGPLGVTMALKNVTEDTVKVSEFPPSFPIRVEAGDGTTWDTVDLMAHSWPMSLPTPLAPGASQTVQPQQLSVQFPGPLTVFPTCAGQRMPALHADVANPGPLPTPNEALDRAVSATSGLFDMCMPTATGETVGSVRPPDDPTRSLDVRCAARITSAPGFAIVTLVISTPASEASPTVPVGLLLTPDLATDRGNAETVAWRFVVTSSDVLPVASATHTRTVAADAMDTEYDVSSEGWSEGGRSRCGGEGISWGGDGRSATITFYDVCG